MRVYSRELFVGFLLVLALTTSGCQPVQPVPESPATATSEAIVESEPVTDTTTLSESAVLSSSTPVAEGGVETSTVTTTDEITVTAAASATGTISVANSQAEPTDAADPELLAAGMAVYRAQYCGVCHALSAAETRGTFGPPHDGMGAIAAGHLAGGTYHGKATTPAQYIHESIVDPQAYVVPGYATTSHRMPSYAHLDAPSLDALVAFLLAQ
jgi:mono/diheme cytochrome c family protein